MLFPGKVVFTWLAVYICNKEQLNCSKINSELKVITDVQTNIQENKETTH
jgi:hypothetical protein